MGSYTRLTAVDGHELEAYVADCSTPVRAAIVLIQEIFGLNGHIRSVADDYASQGFWTMAPALFDRAERHVELGYGAEERKRGMQLATQVGLYTALKDVEAALEYAVSLHGKKKAGVLGYCFGGTLAWLAATRLTPAAAVCYYGGRIAEHASEKPKCPVLMHFGKQDAHIPLTEIEKIRKSRPDLPLFLYDAGHGFNCEQRDSYEPNSAALARQRTLEFLRQHL